MEENRKLRIKCQNMNNHIEEQKKHIIDLLSITKQLNQWQDRKKYDAIIFAAEQGLTWSSKKQDQKKETMNKCVGTSPRRTG